MTMMNELFQKGRKNFEARERTSLRIQKAQRYLERLEKHSWIDLFIKPLAEALKPYFPDREVAILEPFGLLCRITLHLNKIGVDGDRLYKGDNILSLELEPFDIQKGEFKWVDTNVDTHMFGKNTIGTLNGCNNPSYPIPEDATVEDIVEIIKKVNYPKEEEVQA